LARCLNKVRVSRVTRVRVRVRLRVRDTPDYLAQRWRVQTIWLELDGLGKVELVVEAGPVVVMYVNVSSAVVVCRGA